MSEITRAENIIKAYAFDEDGLTRKECLKEGFSNKQCRALVTVLGRGKKGMITPQDAYILKKKGFSKRFVNELLRDGGGVAAQLRMEWLKDHEESRRRRDARYCSTIHCLTIWNEFVEIRDILSNKLSNETSHNDALFRRRIWLQKQRDARAERLQADRDHIADENVRIEEVRPKRRFVYQGLSDGEIRARERKKRANEEASSLEAEVERGRNTYLLGPLYMLRDVGKLDRAEKLRRGEAEPTPPYDPQRPFSWSEFSKMFDDD